MSQAVSGWYTLGNSTPGVLYRVSQALYRPRRNFVDVGPHYTLHSTLNRVLVDVLKPAQLPCIESLHMLSRVLGLTLYIVTLARRAYFAQVLLDTYYSNISNSVDDSVVYQLQPGTYTIVNLGTSTLLRGYREDEPIFVAYTREDPASFALWNIESTGSEVFRIFNLGLGQPACIAREAAEVVSCDDHPAEFFIRQVAEGAYMIGTEDKVWTVDAFPVFSKASSSPDRTESGIDTV
ncbi:hypothetical protein B0H16DRAFT_1737745 [Mycena metata]|uniref:Uncharacterized protein n=1 Tax=Mycena metata TaxID=1033252 RepID=A0AAD7HJU9_9AGAR|nr:hypothetical protein B0H16DRAFT_1737745 [Mycena metata]